jgi:hypothetical protein
MNSDALFCLSLLRLVHAEVKKFRPEIKLWRAAWVYHFGRGQWEFHGPDAFYWNGRAANAYDARQKGWNAWLNKMGAPQ